MTKEAKEQGTNAQTQNRNRDLGIAGWVQMLMLFILFHTPMWGKTFTPYPDGLSYDDRENWSLFEHSPTKPYDAFIIPPTMIFDAEKPRYIDIKDEIYLSGVAEFKSVAVDTVFKDTPFNLYMPKYRQLNPGTLTDEAKLRQFWQDIQNDGLLPIRDVLNAFDYYLKNVNHGRPFVIFSHSQGSVTNAAILALYLPRYVTKAQQRQLIASYLVGIGLTDLVLQSTIYQASTSPTDVNTIVSWNTATKSEVQNKYRITWGDKTTRAVNPLTFTSDRAYVEAARNPMSFLRWFESDKLVGKAGLTGAQIVKSPLSSGDVVLVDIGEADFLTPEQIASEDDYDLGYTHHWDISLFAESVRENLILRAKALEKTKANQ
ncbi:MAG: DUF3089 domain-containing protein [Fusobacteriaceae bacterium]|jgi:hypothetical protein|nr:DUF3089 domain-containing protein [Fusobacteriaceae bacterium]